MLSAPGYKLPRRIRRMLERGTYKPEITRKNNRKTTHGRNNQYVQFPDGRTKLIRHLR